MLSSLPDQLYHKDQSFIITPLKKAKNFRLRYNYKWGQFCITVPAATTKQEVEGFLHRAHPWLSKKVEHYKNEVHLTHGKEISLLGETYYIEHRQDLFNKIIFNGNAIVIYSPTRNYKDLLETSLKEKALSFFKERSLEYAQQLEVGIRKVTVRNTYSRWGSCSANGDLAYNWRLIFASRDVADYICAHEVSHRRYMDHSKSFWKTVASICPNYKLHYSWLKHHGSQLFLYKIPQA